MRERERLRLPGEPAEAHRGGRPTRGGGALRSLHPSPLHPRMRERERERERERGSCETERSAAPEDSRRIAHASTPSPSVSGLSARPPGYPTLQPGATSSSRLLLLSPTGVAFASDEGSSVRRCKRPDPGRVDSCFAGGGGGDSADRAERGGAGGGGV